MRFVPRQQMQLIQTALSVLFPPGCLGCRARVSDDFGLCGTCWKDMHFIGGTVCVMCGAPLTGDDCGVDARCDDCTTIARPWDQGRAALIYKGTGRSLVLGLKHGDRHDVVQPAAHWMARALRGTNLCNNALVVPVPLHWRRQLRRRYNQAALLAAQLAKLQKLTCLDDGLRRVSRTAPMDGKSRDERFAQVQNCIRVAAAHEGAFNRRPILLVDDVMTSGATLSACAQACLAAGAAHITVMTLARVVKDA